MSITLTSASKLLFIGDSITDCGQREDKEGLGSGYVRVIRDYLAAKDPGRAPQVLNRGISGNKITDLKARWHPDVLALRPDLLSIYIGINDVWHGLNPGGQGVSVEQYVPVYRELLAAARRELPHCAIVLCEPSVIWPPQPAEAESLLKPYIQAVHAMASEFKTGPVVKLNAVFNQAKAARPELAWTGDGVHPTSTGHMLIARTWLAATGLL